MTFKINRKIAHLSDHLADLPSSLATTDKMDSKIADILSDEMFSTFCKKSL